MVLVFMFSASWRLTVVTFVMIPLVLVICKVRGGWGGWVGGEDPGAKCGSGWTVGWPNEVWAGLSGDTSLAVGPSLTLRSARRLLFLSTHPHTCQPPGVWRLLP